jgi:uncharacterized protein YbjT (DUF2867 family)
MIQGVSAFAVAAREARLEHVVGLTQWLASPSHPAQMTRQSWLADRMLSMIPGVARTVLNPGFFAEGYLETLGFAVHLGVLPWIFGDSRNAPPSAADIAAVAVAALTDPARHGGKRYRPTGPVLLGADDMARATGRALGRAVRVVPTPLWMFMKAARYAGLPIDLLSAMPYYVHDHRLGAFEVGAPTGDVLEVTGRPPEDFETVARRHAALPQYRRTTGNLLRELLQTMVTPLRPAYDLERYYRELRRPVPAQPQLARESAVWQREHILGFPHGPTARPAAQPPIPAFGG